MRLDALSAVDEATVFAAGAPVGTLRRTDAGVVFAYDAGYAGPPVATSLPVHGAAPDPRPGAVPPFFAGLLPEGRRLTALRVAAKTSADDDLTLLMAVGADTVGHVQVFPSGEPVSAAEDDPVGAFEDVKFHELFASVLGRDPADRVGLPGVQDKISGRMISLPVAYAADAWILKLNPPEFPHLVENEAFFLDAAKASGLAVAHHTVVHDADGATGLLVRRFDRTPALRLPQEDGCQVARRYPADKYRLTSEELVTQLSAQCGAPIVAARTLLQQLVFAYVSCNGDAHAKNFSIVRRVGEWVVSPAYDLPSSHPYGDTTMALTVQGKRSEDIGRADFLALAGTVGVRERAAARVVDELLDAVPQWRSRLDELPFDARRVHMLGKAVDYRMARLRG